MAAKGLSSSRWAPGARSTPSGWGARAFPAPAAPITLPVPVGVDFPPPQQTPGPTANGVSGTDGGLSPNGQNRTGTSVDPRQEAARAAAELSRYTRIVRRMKWKHPFLDYAYRLATGAAADVAEAELMFKLDFFEYYNMLERALVHLQLAFGIVISREHSHHNGKLAPHDNSRSSSSDDRGPLANGTGGGGSPDDRGPRRYTHSYHANVLAALDSPVNPLNGTLGGPEVRRALNRAKELRNRWKNADADAAAANGGPPATPAVLPNGKQTAPLPLESYDLSNILAVIHGALDRAYLVAEDYVRRLNAEAAAAADAGAGQDGLWEDVVGSPSAVEEDQWEFFVEAMDWEAI